MKAAFLAGVLLSGAFLIAEPPKAASPIPNAPTTQGERSDALTPPPIGTKEAVLVKQWRGKRIDKTNSFKLPNGAVVQTNRKKVCGGYWEPFVGMAEADLLAFNYESDSVLDGHTRYRVTDETENRRRYVQEGGVDSVIVELNDSQWKVAFVSHGTIKMRLPR